MSWAVHNVDCLEFLKSLPDGSVDAVVADPPYGINWKQGHDRRNGHARVFSGESSRVIGDDRPFDPSPFLDFPKVVLWGANYFSRRLPDRGGWMIWFKTDGIGNTDFSDAEMAWYSTSRTTKVFKHRWAGFLKDSERGVARVHPTQKSIEVMKWCMDMAKIPDGATVFDPFCGSGTTGVACVLTGRNFIGCEIDAGYCEIARRRIAEAESSIGVFTPGS